MPGFQRSGTSSWRRFLSEIVKNDQSILVNRYEMTTRDVLAVSSRRQYIEEIFRRNEIKNGTVIRWIIDVSPECTATVEIFAWYISTVQPDVLLFSCRYPIARFESAINKKLKFSRKINKKEISECITRSDYSIFIKRLLDVKFNHPVFIFPLEFSNIKNMNFLKQVGRLLDLISPESVKSIANIPFPLETEYEQRNDGQDP